MLQSFIKNGMKILFDVWGGRDLKFSASLSPGVLGQKGKREYERNKVINHELKLDKECDIKFVKND